TSLIFRPSLIYGYADHRDLHSFPTRRSSDLNFEEKQLAFAIIPHTSAQMRTSRGPSWCGCRLSFFIALNKKITRIGRQLLNVAHVYERRLQVKKYGLIFRVHRINRLAWGNQSVNFCGGLFHLLSVSQDYRREWITNHSNEETESNKKRNYFSPCLFARDRSFQGPMQCMSGVAHRQQPCGRRYHRHGIPGQCTGNEVYSEKRYRCSPGESDCKSSLSVIVKF